MSQKMLTVEEIAEELRVHPETVRQWIRNGELIAIDISKEYRILRSDLDAFLAQRRGRRKRRKKTEEEIHETNQPYDESGK
jgi:excisionase family DNA binding protein